MLEKFVVRYQESTPSHWGIEHINGFTTPEELLERARELGKQNDVGEPSVIQWNCFGTLRPIWNLQRSQRPERKGDGWYEDVVTDAFGKG